MHDEWIFGNIFTQFSRYTCHFIRPLKNPFWSYEKDIQGGPKRNKQIQPTGISKVYNVLVKLLVFPLYKLRVTGLKIEGYWTCNSEDMLIIIILVPLVEYWVPFQGFGRNLSEMCLKYFKYFKSFVVNFVVIRAKVLTFRVREIKFARKFSNSYNYAQFAIG